MGLNALRIHCVKIGGNLWALWNFFLKFAGQLQVSDRIDRPVRNQR